VILKEQNECASKIKIAIPGKAIDDAPFLVNAKQARRILIMR
jgi:hypothetical protein